MTDVYCTILKSKTKWKKIHLAPDLRLFWISCSNSSQDIMGFSPSFYSGYVIKKKKTLSYITNNTYFSFFVVILSTNPRNY
jgi:hypothetical protein